MRYLGLLIIFLAVPLAAAWLRQDPRKNRNIALLIVGLFLFFTGPLQINASLVTNPFWQGTSKGMILSLVDSIVAALYITNINKSFKKPFLLLIALFAIPVVISMFIAFDKKASSYIVFQIVQMTLFYLVLTQELVNKDAITSLLKGMALGLLLNAVVVLNQKLHGEIQAPGLTIHQNILGICVELSAIPILAAVLEGGKSKLFLAGLLAALVIIAGGGSRGTMIFFSVGVALTILLSLIRFPTPRKWMVVGAGAVACCLVTPLALLTVRERFGSKSVITDEIVRADFEQAARWMAQDHPLGVGANNYVIVNNIQGYAARAGLPWGGTTRQAPAHNVYLLTRAETGWAGEITLILLMGGVATAGYGLTFKHRKRPVIGLAIGSAAAVTVVALHSNYEFAWYLSDVQRIFFANMAVIAACAELARRESRERRKSLRTQREMRLQEDSYGNDREIEGALSK